ncbi:MAG: tRNA pseudouridine(55) synthase TruB [Lachnospiraceae bacterium]|nr:tRNA pseudouridine(55) synthase TruB [Lachnospiraceae bacterium]
MKNGVINIYKEKGWTSHDVVARLRGILKQKKTGHIGTLDPAAEGVLPVCVGNATKLAEMLADHDKEYEAELIFGLVTDTDDETGKVISETKFDDPERWIAENRERIDGILSGFRGEYMQVPPMYSAKKINGKKLYEYARAGVEIEREPAKVFIYSAEILDAYVKDGRPVLRIRVSCSKGTYIRVLCSDIGNLEGSGACMGSLLRTGVGSFRIEDSVRLGKLETAEDPYEFVTDTDTVLSEYPMIRVNKRGEPLLNNGNILTAGETEGFPSEDGIYRIHDTEGRLKALYEKKGGRMKPAKMLL